MAASAAESDCSCTNISIMQLFHELKQKFPAVPDRVVSECIRQNFHDKGTCEAILSRENVSYLLHSYPTSLKMSSSGSSEPEGLLSARLHNLTICERCTADQPHTYTSCPSRGQTNESLNPNITGETCLQTTSRNPYAASGTHQGITHSAKSVLRKSDSRWHYQQIDNGMNSSQSSINPKLHMSQENSSVSGAGDQYSVGSVHNPHTFISQRENMHVYHSSENVPQLDESSLVPHDFGAMSSTTTCPKMCSRPTSLNVSQSNSYHYPQTYSAPVIPTNFEPFHNNNNVHPTSACDRPGDGSLNVPHIGAYQHISQTSKNESTVNNNNYFSGNGSPSVTKEMDSLPYGDRTVLNSYQVNVNCSLQRSGAGSTVNVSGSSSRTVAESPKIQQRAKSTVHVQPAPHYAGDNLWTGGGIGSKTPGSVSLLPQQQQRSYTSVNLTLRPPSSEPQAPIDIHSGGSSLMYSTSSYDPRQGFQSKLQICIGPGGVGSVSAMRTHTYEPGRSPQIRPQARFVPAPELSSEEDSLPERPVSSLTENTMESTSSENTIQDQLQPILMEHLQSSTQALLEQQLERKNRLQQELRHEKEKLRAMKRNARDMEQDLERRRQTKNNALPAVSTVQKVQRLKQEIRKLTEECKKMTQEVDNCSDSQVPLGETDEEFYKNIYTGQRGNVTAHLPSQDVPPNRAEPRRPAPPPPDSDPREGSSWTCSECTFQNYWALEYCEQCEMPRIMLGTDSVSQKPCYCHPHPSADKLYPSNPLTTIPLMNSISQSKTELI